MYLKTPSYKLDPEVLGKKTMLMNETGENVCMRAMDPSTLFILTYSRKQLALWSDVQYYVNCPRICTSAGRTLTSSSRSD